MYSCHCYYLNNAELKGHLRDMYRLEAQRRCPLLQGLASILEQPLGQEPPPSSPFLVKEIEMLLGPFHGPFAAG